MPTAWHFAKGWAEQTATLASKLPRLTNIRRTHQARSIPSWRRRSQHFQPASEHRSPPAASDPCSIALRDGFASLIYDLSST
jgi:hypothetical protein